MSLELLGYIELPGNIKPGGFDHAAVHCGSGRLYVAHTANDCLEVIDCVHDRYLHSIGNLTGVAGALGRFGQGNQTARTKRFSRRDLFQPGIKAFVRGSWGSW